MEQIKEILNKCFKKLQSDYNMMKLEKLIIIFI